MGHVQVVLVVLVVLNASSASRTSSASGGSDDSAGSSGADGSDWTVLLAVLPVNGRQRSSIEFGYEIRGQLGAYKSFERDDEDDCDEDDHNVNRPLPMTSKTQTPPSHPMQTRGGVGG